MAALVDVREVGPRDGLQAEPPVAVADRVRLIDALLDTGVRHIEACSFVSPRAVPSMAGADEVMAALGRRPGVTYTALVPNVKGAELALAAGVDELTVTVSASPVYNEHNVHMTVDQSVTVLGEICALAGDVPVDAVVSCAFGSPYEGEIPVDDVVALGTRLREAGASSLTYADTTGLATRDSLGGVLERVGKDVGLHLHDSGGRAVDNALAALSSGVRRFDTSVGGLGGSPFAEGAGGNLATEDFVDAATRMGFETGVDLGRLLEVGPLVADLVGHPLASRLAGAG